MAGDPFNFRGWGGWGIWGPVFGPSQPIFYDPDRKPPPWVTGPPRLSGTASECYLRDEIARLKRALREIKGTLGLRSDATSHDACRIASKALGEE